VATRGGRGGGGSLPPADQSPSDFGKGLKEKGTAGLHQPKVLGGHVMSKIRKEGGKGEKCNGGRGDGTGSLR